MQGPAELELLLCDQPCVTITKGLCRDLQALKRLCHDIIGAGSCEGMICTIDECDYAICHTRLPGIRQKALCMWSILNTL
jgi:hypothetical protein